MPVSSEHKRIYDEIERLIRLTAKDIEDGDIKVEVIKNLVAAQGALNGKSANTV